MKYILVTGGVISGIGKGVVSSSIGTLLKSMGFRVTAIKIDPYINIDASLFSPYEHGEVFVLDDGGEVDLDLGNYERFLDITLNKDSNITTGKIYKQVIERERRGDYLGKTVQIVPHITDAITQWVERVAHIPVDETESNNVSDYDSWTNVPSDASSTASTNGQNSTSQNGDNQIPEICVIELGGTIGDIEGMPFVEAFRQFARKIGQQNFCCVHVSLVPKPSATGELKTKPTQGSVKELRALGLSPDLIVCRSEFPITEEVKEKISNYCHVYPDQVICLSDQSSIFKVPLVLEEQGLNDYFMKKFELKPKFTLKKRTGEHGGYLHKWRMLANRYDNTSQTVSIALVGKYTKLEDSYASVIKALRHSALKINRKLKIYYIEGTNLEDETKQTNPTKYHEAWQELCKSDGLIVPGGFGDRGVEGKILAIEHARVSKKPFLGVCLGYQCAVVEFARNVLEIKDADLIEAKPTTPNPVVIEMPEHVGGDLGGTMRVGRRETRFVNKNSQLFVLYGKKDKIYERHRHRYEVNPEYIKQLEEAGMLFVGKDDTGERMEIMELDSSLFDHPYFVGVQYHPEYTSRPLKPSPVYLGLLLASANMLDSYLSRGSPEQNSESDDQGERGQSHI